MPTLPKKHANCHFNSDWVGFLHIVLSILNEDATFQLRAGGSGGAVDLKAKFTWKLRSLGRTKEGLPTPPPPYFIFVGRRWHPGLLSCRQLKNGHYLSLFYMKGGNITEMMVGKFALYCNSNRLIMPSGVQPCLCLVEKS